MEDTNKIEQQLESISTSLEDISSTVYDFSENYNGGNSTAGMEIIIIIVLICINSNIKKLTQAIKEKR